MSRGFAPPPGSSDPRPAARRGWVAAVAVAWLGCGSPPAARDPVIAAPARAPRLVVLLVIDQLPAWAFERDRALYRGGLARLAREGAYAVAELPYASTFTAPGHATIATGALPRVHGVIGNQWFRRVDGRDRPAEHDPAASVLSVDPSAGVIDETASGEALQIDGVADVLRRATAGRARSIAIALKARAACLVAGRRPDLAVFFDADAGGMTTSRAYAPVIPSWLAAHARAHPAGRFVGQVWTPRDPALLARATGIADGAPGEGDAHGLGVAFPHPVGSLEAIVHTPFADELVLETVVAAIDALELGADDTPDLLAISLNAHDYAGHVWGPDSWEVLDLTLRLDASLGRLFEHLDGSLGRDGWAAVVTSDHGATPIVERSPHAGARRIATDEVARAIEAAVARTQGRGPWVASVVSSQAYLSERWHALPPDQRSRTQGDAIRAVSAIPGIAAVHAVADLPAGCAGTAGVPRAVCNAAAPGASGELYLVPADGSLISRYATGTHHDAPGDDNRRVPVFVRAAGVVGDDRAASLLQVAPTVAALLGVPAPPGATAAPLFGIRARPPARP